MPYPLKPTEAHKQIIAQVLSEDIELRDLARAFVKRGLWEMNEQLHRGDARTRAAIATSLAGVVTKAITDSDESDADGNLRAEMHAMFDEMRGELEADEPVAARVIVPKQ